MTEDKKGMIQPGATLFNFHIFAMNEDRAMWVPLIRDTQNRPVKPFILTRDELPCDIPQWQLTWGAQASLTMRNVIMPPMFGMF